MATATATGMDTGMEMRNRPWINRLCSAVILLCPSAFVLAQQSTGSEAGSGNPAWVIKPRIVLTETLTDNVSVNQSNGGRTNDLITEIAPGIRVEANTKRLKAYLDYSLRNYFYARQSDSNQTQNALTAFGTLEAIDNWLFLDFDGRIAQQSISAFGAQSPGNGTINNNSTETSSYRISPYIRGQFGGIVEYLLRYNASTTKSDSSAFSDTDISSWTGQIRGSTPFQTLRWTVDANEQSVHYGRSRDTDSGQLRGMLTYTVFPQFRVSVSGGQESNNYVSLDQKSYDTYGYGFDWSPTERTLLSAFKERRFFGDGHNINFSHRFPMSSIRFSDVRDVSVLPNQFTTVGLGTVYDLYFQQFANLIPDPVARANFVNALLAFTGVPANAQVTSGFLTSQATVQRNQSLSLALFGVRNSITVLANRTESQSVLAATLSTNDFSQSNVVRQQGVSVNFSHRLSEISNLNALVARQESKGSGSVNGNLKATTTTYQVNLSTRLGAKTTGSLSARRSEFDSSTNPFTENALIGTISFVY